MIGDSREFGRDTEVLLARQCPSPCFLKRKKIGHVAVGPLKLSKKLPYHTQYLALHNNSTHSKALPHQKKRSIWRSPHPSLRTRRVLLYKIGLLTTYSRKKKSGWTVTNWKMPWFVCSRRTATWRICKRPWSANALLPVFFLLTSTWGVVLLTLRQRRKLASQHSRWEPAAPLEVSWHPCVHNVVS